MQTHLQTLQRKLRNNMSQPEKRLWYFIRNEQLGIKFRRQYVIGKYILDFYSPECKLCIELDGDSHYKDEMARQKDLERDKSLISKNIKILRFTNINIKENLDGVINIIKEAIAH